MREPIFLCPVCETECVMRPYFAFCQIGNLSVALKRCNRCGHYFFQKIFSEEAEMPQEIYALHENAFWEGLGYYISREKEMFFSWLISQERTGNLISLSKPHPFKKVNFGLLAGLRRGFSSSHGRE